MTVTLQFDDPDQLAEFLWAVIARASDEDRIILSHESWVALPPEGKEAARQIALTMLQIFGGSSH